jgi:MFS family permease
MRFRTAQGARGATLSAPLPATSRRVPGIPQQYATRVAFFLGGFSLAAWAPLVPYAQARLGVDPATLGWIMLCLGTGSIIAIPFAGAMAGRIGCRKMIWIAGTTVCAALPVMATATTPLQQAFALLMFGAAVGSFDVVVNIHALLVQEAAGRPMMPGFHALWSVGGFVGSGSIALLMASGLSLIGSVGVLGVVIIAMLLVFGRLLLDYGEAEPSKGMPFAIPRGIVLLIGVLIFLLYLSEESMLDWSALLLTSRRNMETANAGLGYSMWSGAMMIGRFAGDKVVRRFGSLRVVVAGGLLAAAGLCFVVGLNSTYAGLVGFAVVGLGMSNIIPALYTAIGRQKVMPPNLGLAAAITMGYVGTLSGPPIIGAVAQHFGLGIAYLGVAAGLLFVTLNARWILR